MALFAGLCFWRPSKVANIKSVRKIYEKAMQNFFQNQEEEELFVRQMESGNYEKVDFYNVNQETYPFRFMAGPDFLLFFNGPCRLVRTADIQSIHRQDESTRVSFNAGGRTAQKAVPAIRRLDLNI